MEVLRCPKCDYDLQPQLDVEPVVRCPECGSTVREADCRIPPGFSWKFVVVSACVPIGVAIVFRLFAYQFVAAADRPYLAFGAIAWSLYAGAFAAVIAGVFSGVRTVRLYRRRVSAGHLLELTSVVVFATLVVCAIANTVLAFTIVNILY